MERRRCQKHGHKWIVSIDGRFMAFYFCRRWFCKAWRPSALLIDAGIGGSDEGFDRSGAHNEDGDTE